MTIPLSNEFFQELFDLEHRLLDPQKRKDRAELESLLAPEFFEFGSSGKTWSRQEIIELLTQEFPVTITTSDFKAHVIAENAILITFTSHKVNADASITHALRSSIWKFAEGRWQNVFHQGTNF